MRVIGYIVICALLAVGLCAVPTLAEETAAPGAPVNQKETALGENIRNLRDRAGNFNAKLKLFDETARKDGPLIKSVVAYDDLVREMGIRVAEAKK